MPLLTLDTYRRATRSVTPALAPVRANFTGTVRPSLKLKLSSVLMGGRTQAVPAGVENVTVTWNVALAGFPAASAALQVTVVVPGWNSDPEAGVQLTSTGPSTASTAVGAA